MVRADDKKKKAPIEEPILPEVENKDNPALKADKDMPSNPTKPVDDVPEESSKVAGTEEAAMDEKLKTQHSAAETPVNEVSTDKVPEQPPKAVVVPKPTLDVGKIDTPEDGPAERGAKAKKRALDAEHVGAENVNKMEAAGDTTKAKRSLTDSLNNIPTPGTKTNINTGGLNRHQGAVLQGIESKFHSLLPVKGLAFEANSGVNMWEQAKNYVNEHFYFRFRDLQCNLLEGNFGYLRGEVKKQVVADKKGVESEVAMGYNNSRLVSLDAVTASVDVVEKEIQASMMAPEGHVNFPLKHKFHMLMCLVTPRIGGFTLHDTYRPWVELVGLQRTPCPVQRNPNIFPPHVRLYDTQDSVLQSEHQVMTQDVDSWNKIVTSKLLAGEHVDKSTKARYLDGVISKGAWTEASSYGGVLFSALSDLDRLHRLSTAIAFETGDPQIEVMSRPLFHINRLEANGDLDSIGHAGGIIARLPHAAHVHEVSPRHVVLVADDDVQARHFMRAWDLISAPRKAICYTTTTSDVKGSDIKKNLSRSSRDPLRKMRDEEYPVTQGGVGKVYTDIYGGEVRPVAAPMLHILIPAAYPLGKVCYTWEAPDPSPTLSPGVVLEKWLREIRHHHMGEEPQRIASMSLKDPSKPEDPSAKEPTLVFPGESTGMPAGSSESDFRPASVAQPYRDETWRVWYIQNRYNKITLESMRKSLEVFIAAYAKQHMVTDGMVKSFQETVALDGLRILHGAPSIGHHGEAKWGTSTEQPTQYVMAHPLPCYRTATTQSHCDKFATARLLRLVEHSIEGWAGITSLIRGPFDAIYSRSLDNYSKIQMTLCLALSSSREMCTYMPMNIEEMESVLASKDELDCPTTHQREMFLKGMKAALLQGRKSVMSIRCLSIAATVLGEKVLSSNLLQQLNRPERRELTAYASDDPQDWNNEGFHLEDEDVVMPLSCNIRFGNYSDENYRTMYEKQSVWVPPSATLQSWTGWRLWSSTNLQSGDIMRMGDFSTYDVQAVPSFLGPDVSYGIWEDDVRQSRLNMYALTAADTNNLYAYKKMARICRIPNFLFQIWDKMIVQGSMTPTFPNLPVPVNAAGRYIRYAMSMKTQSPTSGGVEPHMVFAELPVATIDGARLIPFVSLLTDISNMANRRSLIMLMDQGVPAEQLPVVSAIEDPLLTMRDVQLPTAPRDAPIRLAMEL